jgi:hypothetical protein
MKKWLDKYEAPKAQNGIEGTMGGLTDKGFNYNGAWGGTMQMGGKLTAEQLESLNLAKMRSKMALAAEFGNPSAKRMTSVSPSSYRFSGNEMIDGKPVRVRPGETGTHYMSSMGEYAVPYIQEGPNGKLQFKPNASFRDREAIRFDNPKDAQYFAEHYKEVAPMMRQYAMGGSLPGAVGFTYARTGDIPSNGPYAKKTKASAQNGRAVSDNTRLKPIVTEKPMNRETVRSTKPFEAKDNRSIFNDSRAKDRMNNEYSQYVQNIYKDTFIDQIPYAAPVLAAKAFNEGLPFTALSELIKQPLGVVGDAAINAIQENPESIDVKTLEEKTIPYTRLAANATFGNPVITQIGKQRVESGKKKGSKWYDFTAYELPALMDAANSYGVDGNTFTQFIEDNWKSSGGSYKKILELADKKFPKKQNGGEMKYYQEGLDFKPKTISQDGTYVKSPRTDMLTMDEYRLQQALADQPVIQSPKGKQLSKEEINKRNKDYAQQTGKKFDEKTGKVSSRFSPQEEKTLNRIAENIVMPALTVGDVMGGVAIGAPLVKGLAKGVGKAALKKLPTVAREAMPSPQGGMMSGQPIRPSNTIFGMSREEFDRTAAELAARDRLNAVDPSVRIRTLDDMNLRIEEFQTVNQVNFNDLTSGINERFGDIGQQYGLTGNITEDAIIALPEEDKANFLTSMYQAFPARLRRSDFVSNPSTTSASRLKNRSGLTKEEALQKASEKDKDIVSKMTEDEFANTVIKPTGEVVPFYSGDTRSKFADKQAINKLPVEEYVNTFNTNINILNDIIAKRNKSGVNYSVKELDPYGKLTFYTPEQTIDKQIKNENYELVKRLEKENERLLNEIDQVENNPDESIPNHFEITKYWNNKALEKNNKLINKFKNEPEFKISTANIPAGETSWSLGINPGKWEGDVEDITSPYYLKSIPGLEMRNTTAGVFSDRTPRRGTGTYESINEYLKELGLGRVKPGFNSQTDYSRGLWENAVKKGKAVGYYNDPRTVYASMKGLLPYAGLGALGAGAIEQKRQGGGIKKDDMGYWNPENWGEPVEIDSNQITMEGVYEPLIGISDTGDVQYMEPGEEYEFDGESVTEYPIAKGGISVNSADAQPIKKLDQLLNFTNYNKPSKGGWLDKYN